MGANHKPPLFRRCEEIFWIPFLRECAGSPRRGGGPFLRCLQKWGFFRAQVHASQNNLIRPLLAGSRDSRCRTLREGCGFSQCATRCGPLLESPGGACRPFDSELRGATDETDYFRFADHPEGDQTAQYKDVSQHQSTSDVSETKFGGLAQSWTQCWCKLSVREIPFRKILLRVLGPDRFRCIRRETPAELGLWVSGVPGQRKARIG